VPGEDAFTERVAGGHAPELAESLKAVLAAAGRGEDGAVPLADLAPRLLGAAAGATGGPAPL
jgi:hypothetical protein